MAATAPRHSDEKSVSIGEKESPMINTRDLETSQPVLKYANPLDDPQFKDIDERALLWKIDLKLIPWLSFLYLLSFLDRSAIGEFLREPSGRRRHSPFFSDPLPFGTSPSGNARLYGLAEDIGATPKEVNLAVLLFFISYALFEV